MEPSGQLWPNGEFTVGYAPCGGLEQLETPSEYAAKWDNPLGLALASNSHRAKNPDDAPRGTKGLTSYGRRLVRNSVEMLERAYGVTNISFVTLTLPKLEFEEYWNVSTNWAQIVRVYYQALGRLLGDKLLPRFYAGVTELQPKRTAEEGVPALHVHHVFVGRRRNEKGWRVHPAQIREIWKRAVQRYLWNDYDWDQSEQVEAVRHTAAGYLSKYMSKGEEGEHELCRAGTGWSLPTGWYNVSLPLKRKVTEKIRRDPAIIEGIEKTAKGGNIQEWCEYFFAGVIEEMPGEGPHYFVGKLKREAMESLIEYWRALKMPEP